jgi:LCP family protein required for cell wall assembly
MANGSPPRGSATSAPAADFDRDASLWADWASETDLNDSDFNDSDLNDSDLDEGFGPDSVAVGYLPGWPNGLSVPPMVRRQVDLSVEIPSNFDSAPEVDSAPQVEFSGVRPGSSVFRSRQAELQEDYTGEFEAIESGEWDDTEFEYLDDDDRYQGLDLTLAPLPAPTATPTRTPAPAAARPTARPAAPPTARPTPAPLHIPEPAPHAAAAAPRLSAEAKVSGATGPAGRLRPAPTRVAPADSTMERFYRRLAALTAPRQQRSPKPLPAAKRTPAPKLEAPKLEAPKLEAPELEVPPKPAAAAPATAAPVISGPVVNAPMAALQPAKARAKVPAAGAVVAAVLALKSAQGSARRSARRSGHSAERAGVAVRGRRRRLPRAVVLGFGSLAMVAVLLIGYTVWQLSTIQRNEASKEELDLPGVPVRPTLPPDTAPPPDTTPPATLPPTETVTTIGESLFPETPIQEIPVSSIAPGEGSCADDPACANAPVVVLPEAEKPKQGSLLIDRIDTEFIGGPDAQNILIIGTDSRAEVPDGEEHRFGKVNGQRSDTIMILRISPDGKTAAILSVPRDTYVHITGKKTNDRINGAYAQGIKTLIKTLQENFNLPINHAVEIDFAGFESIVGTLGGVQICFDAQARDLKTGLDQPAGCNVLDSKQATAFVRSRKYETLNGTTWKPDGRGDLGRIARQQVFIRQVLQKAIDSGVRNPLTMNALAGNFKDSVTLDKEFDLSEILDTGRTFSSFEPAALQTFVVPTSGAKIDGKDVLRVDRAAASKLVNQFGQRN